MRPVLAATLLLALVVPARAQEADRARIPLRGVGITTDAASAAEVAALLPPRSEPAERPILDIWVEPDESGAVTSGSAAVEDALAASTGRARVVLTLGGGAGQSLETRLESARSLAALSRGRAAAIKVAEVAICGGDAAAEAFTLKKTILALREQEPLIPIALESGASRERECERAEAAGATLSPEDLAALWPFLDAIVIAGEAQSTLTRALTTAPPPGLPIWQHGVGSGSGDPWQRIVAARANAAPVTTTWGNEERADEWARALGSLPRAIPAEAEVVPSGGAGLTWPEDTRVDEALFVVPSDLSQRLAFGPAPESLRKRASFANVKLSDRVANPRIIDPTGKLDGPVKFAAEPGGVTALQLPLADRPLVLAWDRASSADEVQSDVAIESIHEPTLEEILAKHAQRASFRDGQVTSWTADLVQSMRYSLGSSGRYIDVRIESRYYESEGVKEIENLRYFIDGAPYEPKNGRPPELPLMQPDKVNVVPLDVHLDKSYAYELRGKGEHGGRPAWRVGFRPVAATNDAWQGVALIDAETFDLLATDVTQTGLEPPVLSNQQQETMGAVTAADGSAAWLVREIDVRRVLTIIGSNVAVDMRLEFTNPVVNDAAFEQQLESARASDRQMLRDTETGLKYLQKDESGQRVPVDPPTRKLFFIAGLRFDDSLGPGVIPLGGVNILETDAWGKGIQVNAFLAGAVNSLSISDPSLAGSKWNLTSEAFLPLVRSIDRVLGPDGEDEDTEAAVREPRVAVGVGRPLGPYVQAGVEARVAHQGWDETDDTIDTFHAPSSTWLASLVAMMDVHAHDWDARLSAERAHRSSWDAWGPEDAFGDPTLETPDSYWKWRAFLGRDFRVTSLQTLGFDLEYLGGDDLDRFSQYEFAAFGGSQLPGFEDSGLHFDEAQIARLKWSIQAFGKFGLDAKIGAARVRDSLLSPAEVARIGFEGTHVGFGVGATFPGPWRTVVRVEVGTPISSVDHEELEGEITGQFVFTKLLK